MPVPDQGPVSLIGHPQDPEDQHGELSQQGEQQERDAVAALAQTLAKSAVAELEDDELHDAGQIDFEHLDLARKAEVAEKFAGAIDLELPQSAGLPTVPVLHPRLSDGLPRQDFVKEASRSEPEKALDVAAQVSANAVVHEALASLQLQPHLFKTKNAQQEEQPAPQKERVPVYAAPQAFPEQAEESQMALMPIAHVQFSGPAHAPASGGRTLEDSVREMLRPMMLQWLDENMPRILENAIREEIAVRGLVPKPGGQS